MTRVASRGLFPVAVLLAMMCGGCGSDTTSLTGFGELTVGDLTYYPLPLQSPARAVTGQVIAHKNGCVAVVVDGVERMPFWPDGTTVVQDAIDFSTYHVTLPDHKTLNAHQGTGDLFTA